MSDKNKLPADDAPMIEWALYYAGQGIAVFPLQPGTKDRYFKYVRYRNIRTGNNSSWKYQASSDPERVKQFWTDHPDANIGGATGSRSNIFVLDFDTEHTSDDGKLITDGLDRLREWEKENGIELDRESWISKTGRGGCQVFYRADPEKMVSTSGRSNIFGEDTGNDTRGDGNYVVLPPSVHPNGNRYEWEQSPDDCEILTADDAFYAYWNTSKLQGTKAGTKTDYGDLESVSAGRHDALKAYISSVISKTKNQLSEEEYVVLLSEANNRLSIPIGTGDGDRADEFEKTVLPMVKRFIGDQNNVNWSAAISLWEKANDQSWPTDPEKKPWDEAAKLYREKYPEGESIEEGYQKHKAGMDQDGAQVEENPQKNRAEYLRELKASLPPLTVAAELSDEDIPDFEVFVGVGEDLPLLVEGTYILSAKSKIGKSWFAMQMCDAVSKGIDFLGYKTKQCSVLYYDLEAGIKVSQNRIHKIESVTGKLSELFMIESKDRREKSGQKIPLIGSGLEDEIEARLIDSDIGIVVIDVMAKTVKPKPSNMDEYSYYYKIIDAFNSISHRYHIAIILICHDRKVVDASDPFSNILGSTALQGASDQMIVMFKKSYNDPFIHISEKGRNIDGIIDIDVQWIGNRLVRVENVSEIKKMEEYKKSPIYEGVMMICSISQEWSGRCSGFAKRCEAEGIDLQLPLDKAGNTDYRPIGKTFNDQLFVKLLDDEGISLKVTNPSSPGGKNYKITVSTVPDEWNTVPEEGTDALKIRV